MKSFKFDKTYLPLLFAPVLFFGWGFAYIFIYNDKLGYYVHDYGIHLSKLYITVALFFINYLLIVIFKDKGYKAITAFLSVNIISLISSLMIPSYLFSFNPMIFCIWLMTYRREIKLFSVESFLYVWYFIVSVGLGIYFGYNFNYVNGIQIYSNIFFTIRNELLKIAGIAFGAYLLPVIVGIIICALKKTNIHKGKDIKKAVLLKIPMYLIMYAAIGVTAFFNFKFATASSLAQFHYLYLGTYALMVYYMLDGHGIVGKFKSTKFYKTM